MIDNEACASDMVSELLDHADERPTPSCLLDVGPPDFDTGQPAAEDEYWERRT